ncbi:MAG TPA: hypothetical protein VJR95_12670 [Rhodanobacter sp.]|nr:hypothetical protein [Rhodanobacter sp.]
MASSREDKKVELIPRGFLEDVDERKKFALLKESYLSPVADSPARQKFIDNLAAALERKEHGSLARVTAISMLGMLEWRDAFINYVENKLLDPNFSYKRMFALQEQVLALKELEDVATRAIEGRKKGGQNRAAKSPKTQAKAEAFKLWQERHAGKHPELRTNEQFATECRRLWPALESPKVILGWCTEWNKAAKKAQSAS